MKNTRMASIDLLRVIAIFLVIDIHVNVTYGRISWLPPGLQEMRRQIDYCAVPTFFMIAGFFYGQSFRKAAEITRPYIKSVRRLLFIFLVWTLIYAFPHLSPETLRSFHEHGILKTYYWNLQYCLAFDPGIALFTGWTWHLWFLTALVQSMTVIAFFVYFRLEKFLFWTALILYMLTPLVNLYLPPAPPPNGYSWNPQLGLLMSILPVTFGWVLAQHQKFSHKAAFAFLGAGILISLIAKPFMIHVYHLESSYGRLDIQCMAAGFVMLALLHPNFGAGSWVSQWGPFTLGIYCIHMLVLSYLRVFDGALPSPLWRGLVLVLTFLVSLILTALLRKIPGVRRIVS